MQISYLMDIDEIDAEFIRFLKKQYKRAKIQVNIIPLDETGYLTSSEANKQALDEGIQQITETKVIQFNSDDFFAEMQKKLNNA